jgi:unsaturated chondroitin disaccharide hydrolase
MHFKFTAASVIAMTFFTTFFATPVDEKAFIKENLIFSETQLDLLLTKANVVDTLFPRTINTAGEVQFTNKYDWTSGFFAGELWYAYQGTKDENLKKEATRWTEKLESLQYFKDHHDLGFMVYCSYGNAYRLTQNQSYKKVLVQAAKSLSSRFDPKVGSIKSWNAFGSWDGKGVYKFPVIIDNMMNLELLFFASKATGDPSFKKIAIQHADNVLKNQIRPDFSCYHVVCYDPENGKVLTRETAQGYANNSVWARGQAWGVYGFTLCYRETGDLRYLNAACRMADYYLSNKNLPSDKVPYWDFNANDNGFKPSIKSHANETPVKYRDASAAAITASALLELSTYKTTKAENYKNSAIKILHSLASPAYRADADKNGDFIIKHCVGSIPHGVEIDAPLVYADYYFLEALNRYNLILDHKNPISGNSLIAK